MGADDTSKRPADEFDAKPEIDDAEDSGKDSVDGEVGEPESVDAGLESDFARVDRAGMDTAIEKSQPDDADTSVATSDGDDGTESNTDEEPASEEDGSEVEADADRREEDLSGSGLLKPYQGNQPYIFVSYAHKDKKRAMELVYGLQGGGYRVWYDEGIDPGTEWANYIAARIVECGFFIALVSKSYVVSDNCRDELNYAREYNKPRVIVYLEDVDLPKGMQMRLTRLQSIYKNRYNDEADFYKKLFEAEGIEACLSKDGGDAGEAALAARKGAGKSAKAASQALTYFNEKVPAAAKIRDKVPVMASMQRDHPVVSLASALLLLAAAGVVAAWAAVALASALLFPPYALDEATFPDGALRAAVASQADADGDGAVSREEAASLESFAVDGAAALDGLERFPNLRSIEVRGTALQGADLSPFRSLETFSAPDAPLDSLDVSSTPSLSSLDVPDSTEVSGLEATGLTETWLPDSCTYYTQDSETKKYERSQSLELERDVNGHMLSSSKIGYSYDFPKYKTTTTYDYNGQNQLVSTSSTSMTSSSDEPTSTSTTTYTYDDAGRLTSMSTPSSGSTSVRSYTYDSQGSLTAITNSSEYNTTTSSYITNINYTSQGLPYSVTGDNNDITYTYETWSYDSDGMLSSFANELEGGDSINLIDRVITYDESGRIESIKCSPGPLISSQYDGHEKYGYDATIAYAYDSHGRCSGANCTGTYTHGATFKAKASCEYDDKDNISRIDVTQNTAYTDGTTEQTWAFEQVCHRYFVAADDGRVETVLFLEPTLNPTLFNLYMALPAEPQIPRLDQQLAEATYYGYDRPLKYW